MSAMNYEGFVRGAFSINSDNMIDRSGDLAGLAEADIFRLAESGDINYFTEVKIGTGYAIAIFNNEIFNNCSVSDNDRTSMSNLLNQVISAISTSDIITIINSYKVFRDRYFTFRWNRNR
ncbi:hypothetical protein D2A34_05195 [Clostridium chromiireducens]|uniref:Uncharacterized protein n=1 Tax=Clostridium chromiireducens TaxID=225345 RepID=A0A399IX05_9CLOT|nr:hypothetical protein [Clostridium chromiireducens]RII36779.1 hypothetical protein D2A34_05195 [Clostridium chromiireducens]